MNKFLKTFTYIGVTALTTLTLNMWKPNTVLAADNNIVKFVVGDLDGDGKVNAADQALMQSYVSGKIKHFPVEAKLISSISDSVVNVNQGSGYNIPSTVLAAMYDGSKKQIGVTWDKKSVDTTKLGQVVLTGSVSNYDKKVLLTINIQKYIKSIDNINANVTQGDSYKLPAAVNAKMSDGSTASYSIKWNTNTVNTSKAGKFTFTGAVAGYKNNITLTLNVIAKSNSYNLVSTGKYQMITTLSFIAQDDTTLTVDYNIGSLSDSPYQKELSLTVSGPGAQIVITDGNGKKLSAKVNLKYGQTVEYKIIRTIQESGIKYTTDLSKTSGNYSAFADYKKYTSPEDRIESADPAIKSKANELFKGITNPYLKAKKAYEFVNTYMTYNVALGNRGALNALKTGIGDCEDYSELFAALLRASGVPARVATGAWVAPSVFENNMAVADYYGHAWPEFYLPEYGWIVAEPTVIYTVNGQKTVDYDFFANLSTPDHFLAGYNPAGNSPDRQLVWDGHAQYQTYETDIVKIN